MGEQVLADGLTELDAAIAYANAWNSLDCASFVSLLAPDARYTSQYVFEELIGRDAISKYLCGKFKTVKSNGSNIKAVLSTATISFPGKYCVLLVDGNEAVVVVFETKANEICRFGLCDTQLYCPFPIEIEANPNYIEGSMQKPPVLVPRLCTDALDERLEVLLRMHAESIARSGEYASAYCWDNDQWATDVLREKLETGCARAMLAKPENVLSKKRTEALDRYIAACKLAIAALEQVSSAIDGIEQSA
jgi:hypothetical protein